MMIRYNDTSNVANDDDYDDNSIDSIAFAVFGFSKFRLGTQQTRFQIADLLIHGRLPLGRIMISICMPSDDDYSDHDDNYSDDDDDDDDDDVMLLLMMMMMVMMMPR